MQGKVVVDLALGIRIRYGLVKLIWRLWRKEPRETGKVQRARRAKSREEQGRQDRLPGRARWSLHEQAL